MHQYQNVVIDIYLAEPMVQWWMESSEPTIHKHAYHVELPFRDASDEDILETMFYNLNIRHPQDYHNRSLSVGDVITLNGDRSYLCAPLGWQKLQAPMREEPAASCRPSKTAISTKCKENLIDAN